MSSTFKQLKKYLGATNVNWCDLFKSWHVEGAELDQQVPLVDIKKVTLFRGVEEDCLFIQRRPGQYAALIFTSSGAVSKEKLDKDPMLKECIFHLDYFKKN